MNKLNAFPVVLMHRFDAAGVTTYAARKPGHQARAEGFWEGAWAREDGTFFFVLETGKVIEAASAAELVTAVQTAHKPMLRAA